jgi:AcrR family transcriptional regulator
MASPTDDSAPEDGRVRRARALREERRAQILDAARRVFGEKGYHVGSINDIIEAAGIARGTFYLHFESKRAVLDVLLDDLLGRLRALVKRVDVTSTTPPQAQLLANVERVLGLLVDHSDLTRILLREAVGLDEEFDQKLRDFYGQVLALIGRSLHTGMAIGLVREVDVAIVSSCVLGSVREVIAQLVLDAAERPDPAELARVILDYNLRGLLR